MDKVKKQLLEHFSPEKTVRKGAQGLADALGISRPAVLMWGKIDGKIPEVHCYKIEVLTKGKFKFAQLRKIDWRKK